MSPLSSYLIETFATLVVVAVLAVLVLVGARRLGVGRPVGPMQLVGRLSLDARRSVVVVRVADRVLVLGVSEAGLTKLAELEPGDVAVQAEQTATGSFGEVLAKLARARRPAMRDNVPATEERKDG
ncbi:MAG: flagellar biosynthetic protein FliO [Polyangiaceae bacterium]|jgi:flagellar protein FliO/FliZ|nr:flagellar biosynthetic protein FliO [Polyangiaceae bacterium]